MKVKAAHAFAGLSLGLVCAGIYLFALSFLRAGQHSYWLMPVPNELGLWSDFHNSWFSKTGFSLLWQFDRFNVVAILLGATFPISFAVLAWFMASRRPVPIVRRWYVQLALAALSVGAALLISDSISFILPLPPF